MIQNIHHRLVLFDFDGVIADTGELSYELRKKLEPGLTRGQFADYFRGNIWHVVPSVLPTEEMMLEQSKLYSQSLALVPFNKELKEVIEEFAKRYTLAIVSSTHSALIREYLSAQGIDRLFFQILGSDVHTSKSEKIRMILDVTGLTMNDAIFITDTLGDIKSAQKCGVRSVGVSWGFQSPAVLQEGSPIAVVTSLNELKTAVDTFFL